MSPNKQLSYNSAANSCKPDCSIPDPNSSSWCSKFGCAELDPSNANDLCGRRSLKLLENPSFTIKRATDWYGCCPVKALNYDQCFIRVRPQPWCFSCMAEQKLCETFLIETSNASHDKEWTALLGTWFDARWLQSRTWWWKGIYRSWFGEDRSRFSSRFMPVVGFCYYKHVESHRRYCACPSVISKQRY